MFFLLKEEVYSNFSPVGLNSIVVEINALVYQVSLNVIRFWYVSISHT